MTGTRPCPRRIDHDTRDENELVHLGGCHLTDERWRNVSAKENLDRGRHLRLFDQRLECFASTLLHEGEDVIRLCDDRIVYSRGAELEIGKVDLEVVVLVVVVLEEGFSAAREGASLSPVGGAGSLRATSLQEAPSPVYENAVPTKGTDEIARASDGVCLCEGTGRGIPTRRRGGLQVLRRGKDGAPVPLHNGFVDRQRAPGSPFLGVVSLGWPARLRKSSPQISNEPVHRLRIETVKFWRFEYHVRPLCSGALL